MRLGTIITITLLTFCYDACGQDSLNYHGQPFVIRDLPSKSKKTKPPLFIITTDNRIFQVVIKGDFIHSRKVKRTFKQLNPDWIVSMDVLKDKRASEKYGSLGDHGAVIINLKEGTIDKLPHKLKRHEITEKI